MVTTAIALLLGASLCGAVMLSFNAFRTPLPHLAHTLAAVRGETASALSGGIGDGAIPAGNGLVDRWGAWILRVGRLTPSRQQLAQLRLRGISITRFYGERLGSALLCTLIAVMLSMTGSAFGIPLPMPLPVGVVLASAALGWFLPALRIASSAHAVAEDASEALLVYIDLVVLERMANQHAKDALTRAAHISDNPVFRQIQAALARAELEREQPWTELRRLAERLNLPQLADIADIAEQQEEGGSLSAAFRARVAELRNAYIVKRQREADRVTQRMEIPKMLPVIVVSFILILPPLLRIAS